MSRVPAAAPILASRPHRLLHNSIDCDRLEGRLVAFSSTLMADATNIVKTSSNAPTTSVNVEDVSATTMSFSQALQTVCEPEVSFHGHVARAA
jgi:hypothetical protein